MKLLLAAALLLSGALYYALKKPASTAAPATAPAPAPFELALSDLCLKGDSIIRRIDLDGKAFKFRLNTSTNELTTLGKKRLTPAQMAELKAALDRAGYHSLKTDEGRERDCTHELMVAEEPKLVKLVYPDTGGSPELKELYARLVDMVERTPWDAPPAPEKSK